MIVNYLFCAVFTAFAAVGSAEDCSPCQQLLKCNPLTEAQKVELTKETEYYSRTSLNNKIHEANIPIEKVKDQRYHSIIAFMEHHVMMKNQSVLDLGCASGAMLKHFGHLYDTKFGGHSHLSGIELTPAWIEFAKKNQPNNDFFVGDVTEFKPEVGKMLWSI